MNENKNISLKELSKQINRSEGSILKRAAILGVNNKKSKELWTPEEDIILINNIGFAPLFCIMKKLNKKNIVEVANRAKELNLNLFDAAHKKYRRQHNWLYEEDKFLRDNFSTMSYSVIAKAINKTQKQVQTYAKDIGLIEDGKTKKYDVFETNHHGLIFSKKEVEYLKNNFSIGLEELQKKLPGRTRGQIYSKIKCLKLLKRKQTFPEMCVESILISLNLNYEKEYIMKNCERKFIIDFLVDNKYAIEVQGEYWHAKNREKKLTKPQIKNIERDKIKLEMMEKQGYKVLYIWEDDIKSDKDDDFIKCKNIIIDFINNGEI